MPRNADIIEIQEHMVRCPPDLFMEEASKNECVGTRKKVSRWYDSSDMGLTSVVVTIADKSIPDIEVGDMLLMMEIPSPEEIEVQPRKQ